MFCADRNWHKMLKDARTLQQQYYELLPQWTIYQQHEYKYLKQNIGFAIFGPPTEEGGTATLKIKSESADLNDATDIISYGAKAKEVIDIVYNKILEFDNGYAQCIYYAVIYNITFRTKNDPVMTDKSKKDKKDNDTCVYPIPVFKVRKRIQNEKNDTYEVCYIDTQGRIYANWSDYKKCNMLPRCTMVLPQDGIYQLDPNYHATEEYSTVWLDVAQSPASSARSVFLRHMDTASAAAGIFGVGLCVASALTPVAPVMLGVTVLSTLNGMWTIGRSTEHLLDRKSHHESMTDRNALGSWMAISGSALGLVASGGSAVITKLVERGNNIKSFAKTAYNVALLGNLGVNGFGIGYHAYSMYEKYQSEQQITIMDVVSLSAHILFFGNAVLNLKYAGELIETTQGEILKDYRATLRSRHLRKSFNRAKRNAASMHADKEFENAEVIRYINRKLSFSNQTTKSNNFPTLISSIAQNSRRITINGIMLLDPIKFVDILITADKNSSNQHIATDGMYKELRNLLKNLMKSYQRGDIKINFPGFYAIFEDMTKLENGHEIFCIIFKLGAAVMKECPSCEEYLHKSVHFVWNYVKQSLQQSFPNINFFAAEKGVQKRIHEFVSLLFDEIEIISQHLGPAFVKYISFVHSVLNTSTIGQNSK